MRLALLVAIALTLGCQKDAAKAPSGPPPAPVVVGKAVRRAVPVTLHGIGNVEPVASVAIRARVAGPIRKVHIADGAEVARGQALFTIDPEPFRIALARAESELARDSALLKKAQDDAARYETLVAKEYVTREQYEAAVAQAASLAATIQSDEAAIRDAKLDLSYCTITSPIAGRAGNVALREGNLVRASDDAPLVTVVQLRPINVAFALPEKHLAAIRARNAAGPLAVTARERGEEEGQGHRGRLTFVDNTVDRATGTIRLKAEFANDDRGLWPGQFVEVDLALAEQADAVLVPSTAIQVGQQGSFVFVVGDDGTAAVQPVTVDRTVGDQTVVASGLNGGETVITDGQIRVVPGAKVVASAGS